MLTIHQAATSIGVCNKTMRRWEKLGKIKPFRTIGGHRRYTEEMLKKFVSRLVDLIHQCWDQKSQEPIRSLYQSFQKKFNSLINLRNLDPALEVLGMDDKKDFLNQVKWIFIDRQKGKPIKNEEVKNNQRNQN